jgi:hypothetical protein
MLFNSIIAASDSMDRPRCADCAGPMTLSRIEPEKPGHDTRIFECPRCGHSESVVVQFKAP